MDIDSRLAAPGGMALAFKRDLSLSTLTLQRGYLRLVGGG